MYKYADIKGDGGVEDMRDMFGAIEPGDVQVVCESYPEIGEALAVLCRVVELQNSIDDCYEVHDYPEIESVPYILRIRGLLGSDMAQQCRSWWSHLPGGATDKALQIHSIGEQETNTEAPASQSLKPVSLGIAGVGTDAPTETNEKGAKQSATPYRCDLLDASAILELANVLKHGADKYGVDNWRGIEAQSHVNHALIHLFAWLAGDKQDRHLANALCRCMMAVATDKLQ